MAAKNFKLFMGCLGNGTTICNMARLDCGDYKTIGHISEHGVIKLYVDKDYIPEDSMKTIEKVAAKSKEKFMETWNRKTDAGKYIYMCNIPVIGAPYNTFEKVAMENKNLPISEVVKLMEEVFFKTHM